jgi:hypothetical protein
VGADRPIARRKGGGRCNGGPGIRRGAEQARGCERPEASGRASAGALPVNPEGIAPGGFQVWPRSLAFYAISLRLLDYPLSGERVFAPICGYSVPLMPMICPGSVGLRVESPDGAVWQAHAAYAAVISDEEGGSVVTLVTFLNGSASSR